MYLIPFEDEYLRLAQRQFKDGDIDFDAYTAAVRDRVEKYLAEIKAETDRREMDRVRSEERQREQEQRWREHEKAWESINQRMAEILQRLRKDTDDLS